MILQSGWILPVGWVASGRVCAQPAKQACLTEETPKKLFLFVVLVVICFVQIK